MPALGQSQHAADLHEGDLDAHPGEKADEHGAGQKVRQKAQADEAGQDEEGRLP